MCWRKVSTSGFLLDKKPEYKSIRRRSAPFAAARRRLASRAVPFSSVDSIISTKCGPKIINIAQNYHLAEGFEEKKIYIFFYLSCLLSSSFWSYDEWQYYNILQCHRVTPICYSSFISQGLYYFHLVKMSEVIFDQIGLSDPNEGCFTLNSSNLVQFLSV